MGLVAIAAMMSGLLSKTVVSDFKAGFSETEVSGGHLSFHMFEKKCKDLKFAVRCIWKGTKETIDDDCPLTYFQI